VLLHFNCERLKDFGSNLDFVRFYVNFLHVAPTNRSRIVSDRIQGAFNDFEAVITALGKGIKTAKEIQALLKRYKEPIFFTFVQLATQKFDFLLHLVSLFADQLNAANICLQQLIDIDLLVKFEFGEVFLELESCRVILRAV